MTPIAAHAPAAILSLPQWLADELVQAARDQPQHEICGFIAAAPGESGAIRRYPIHNHASDARQRFDMDAGEQIAAFKAMRDRGETLRAIYHSHPSAPARPSAQDLAGHSYPAVAALIISPTAPADQRLRAWGLNGDQPAPIRLLWR